MRERGTKEEVGLWICELWYIFILKMDKKQKRCRSLQILVYEHELLFL